MTHDTLQFGADAPLQFDSAAPHAGTPVATCGSCSEPIRSVYYEINANVVCSRCRGKLESLLSSTGRVRRFRRALGFGLGTAIAGSVFYYGFREVTGIDFGLVAVLVGFMVGKAVFVGGDRRGGRRYQVLAVVLTYFAIASTYVPMVFKEGGKHVTAAVDSAKAASRSGSSLAGAAIADSNTEAAGDSTLTEATSAASPHAAGKVKEEKLGFGKILLAFVGMVLFTAALPILVGMSSIISVVILFFGLIQAWRMNRAVEVSVTGPYRITAPAADMQAAS